MAVSESQVSFSLESAVAQLLTSNGVTLEKALKGNEIFCTMSNGLSWTLSTTECKCAEGEVEKSCEKIARAKKLPSPVLEALRNNASLNEEGVYFCSGGCTRGMEKGLLVFLTVAYKENGKVNMLIVTSDQNVTLAPEVFERVVRTIEPIMTTGKYTVDALNFHYEFPYLKKTGEKIITRTEVEKKERILNKEDLDALRDFCLVKVCQQFLSRERCDAFRGSQEIRRILTHNFERSFPKRDPSPPTRQESDDDETKQRTGWKIFGGSKSKKPRDDDRKNESSGHGVHSLHHSNENRCTNLEDYEWGDDPTEFI